tara:strand:- start:11471 stop:11986 length:516 start_codon:yes stop_codon:yes gene_type:complete
MERKVISNNSSDVFIGLGSNLENPKKQIETAIIEIECLAEISLLSQSSQYITYPMGPSDQPNFLNAVIKISTKLSPSRLLDFLQNLEIKHKRIKGQHWGPRTLDLDILLFGDKVIKESYLRIPHPMMHERIFVLKPLLQIAPDVVIPGKGPAKNYLKFCENLNIRLYDSAS